MKLLCSYMITLLLCQVLVEVSAQYKIFSDAELATSDTHALYKEYLTQHPHKKYAHDSSEGQTRHAYFIKTIAKVQKQRALNQSANSKWTAGLNSLSTSATQS